jgi:Protein of unknown function (DUF3891)
VLVRSDEDGALAIGQLSHAWLSGQIARAWGNGRFPEPDPREEVALGAEQHDIGWAQFDLEPRFDEDSGLPRGFLQTTVDEHLSIWRDAPLRVLSQSAHAALVVSLHGRSLSELRARSLPDQAPLLEGHVAQERERQQRLRLALGLSEQEIQRIRRQMWTWDGISLALCLGWRPFTARDVPTADGLADVELSDGADGVTTIDPWPFAAERVELRCEGRRLGPRYEDEGSMRRAFTEAPLVTLRFTLARAAGT